MPFKNISASQPKRSFKEIDKIICAQVFPSIIPELSNYYVILPNARHSFISSEAGPMKNQDSRKYFALKCLDAGLPYSEIGLWLDERLIKFEMKHTDGITRLIRADHESCLRFDERKPIYLFEGGYVRYISIR
jgi:hypothetical protein